MRILSVLVFWTCIFSSEAKLSFSNIQGQRDFLNALLVEVEKAEAKKKSDNKSANNSDLDKYKKDISTLKKTLEDIEDETAKQKANDKVLQDLVDEYNKKMKELEKAYRFVISKSKKSQKQDEYLGTKSHEVFTIDSLNYGKKRRKMRDVKFRPLELVEIREPSKPEDNMPLPTKENRD